jgi:flagellar motor switch protein FliN
MMTHDEMIARLVAELTRVVGAMLDVPVNSHPAGQSPEDGYVVTLTTDDPRRGELKLHVARGGAHAITKAASGSPLEPTDARVIEWLKELCTQAVSAFDPRSVGGGLKVAGVAAEPRVADVSTGVALEIHAQGQQMALWVLIVGQIDLTQTISGVSRPVSQTLDVIMDIDLPLVVRFGRTEVPLRTLTSLGPGSVIDLGRAPDDPVDVLISNRVVARGEVVIVAGYYGVRVHDVVSPAERARSLEAELS